MEQWGQHHQIIQLSVDFTKIGLHTKHERNPSSNAPDRAHTRMSTKYLDPIKDGTLGAASPKTMDTYLRYTSIQNFKEIRTKIQVIEHTHECLPKYDL